MSNLYAGVDNVDGVGRNNDGQASCSGPPVPLSLMSGAFLLDRDMRSLDHLVRASFAWKNA